MSSSVVCRCGNHVNRNEQAWYCLAFAEVSRVAEKCAGVAPAEMTVEQAFYMAMNFECDWLVTCSERDRILWGRNDEVVHVLRRES